MKGGEKMKNALKVMVLTFAIIGSFLFFSSKSYAATGDYLQIDAWVNYHSTPSTGNTLGSLKSGSKYELLGKYNDYWYKVMINGRTRYVTTMSKYSTEIHAAAVEPAPVPVVVPVPVPVPVVVDPLQVKLDAIVAEGKSFLGTPYKYGATYGNTSSFDCSAFVKYMFRNYTTLPRDSRHQSTVGTKVSRDELKPLDLVFSDTNSDGTINHVAIYIGNDQIMHTYRVGVGVTISKFSGSYWDTHYVTARRVL